MKTVLKTAAGKNVFLCALLAALCFTSCGGESKVVKYLRQDINDAAARYWATFVEENGINAIDEDGDTLLYYAVEKYNDAHLVELCLNAKADYNLQPKGKNELFKIAFTKSNHDVMAVLFKHGVSVRGDEEGNKYDMLYSVFQRYISFWDAEEKKAWADYANFLLSYYTEEQMDYRNYVNLEALRFGWGRHTVFDSDDDNNREIFNVFIEMDKKGYKPHVLDVREFINCYIGIEDEPSLKQTQFEYLQKYIGDKWYKENNKKLIYNDNTTLDIIRDYKNATRTFQVLDEFIKNGYTLEELGAIGWLYNCARHLSYSSDKELNHFLKLLNYAKENGLNLNGKVGKYHILDSPLSLLYDRYKFKRRWNENPDDDETFKGRKNIVNVLLENGINTVSAKYDDGYDDYNLQSAVEELGLTDKITVATDEE